VEVAQTREGGENPSMGSRVVLDGRQASGSRPRPVRFAVLAMVLAVAGDVFAAEIDLVDSLASTEALDAELLFTRPLTWLASGMGALFLVAALDLAGAVARTEIGVPPPGPTTTALRSGTPLRISSVAQFISKRGPPLIW
jgi:hypothetical protein